MKKYFLKGSAVLILGGLMASCTHDEIDYSAIVESKKAAYQEVFVKTYGKIDPNHTWGFGAAVTTTKGLTRAVDTWSHTHIDEWVDDLKFTVPEGAEDISKSGFNQNATVFYVPETYRGAFTPNVPSGGAIYNYGEITSMSGNLNGIVTIYNAGTIEDFGPSTGSDHIVYNTGTLNVVKYSNIGNLYNIGTLVLEDTDIPNDMSIYSTVPGSITLPNGGDLKAACDIHNTIYSEANLKIQNKETQYVCGLEVDGTLDMTQGKLEASYIFADEIKFDGSSIWLLPEGYILANTIKMPNSASYIYGYEGSSALVEATDWYFRNHNNFESAFSSNVYFKVDGSIDIEEILVRENGQQDNVSTEYATADDYLASQNGQELEGRINSINTGKYVNPVCEAAGGGSTDVTIPTDKGEITGDSVEVITTTKKYETRELVESGRVFCEDLGQISASDLDFNDVVFDAYVYKVTPSTQTIVEKNGEKVSEETVEGESFYRTAIVLLAAGGTLELKVANKSAHQALGNRPNSTIINTIEQSGDRASQNPWAESNPVLLGIFDDDFNCINDIPIWVNYGNNSVLKLEAEPGLAPHKICVPIGTKWCKEREKMEEAYEGFGDWVNNAENVFWDGGTIINSNLLYLKEGTYELPTEVEAGTHQIGEDVKKSYDGSESSSGGYQGETVLSRQLR